MFSEACRFFIMFTYNITFVTAPHREQELTDYLRKNLIPALFNSSSPALNPELKKVVEIGGESPDSEHGLSIALSASFVSLDEANSWYDNTLEPALHDLHLKFGPYALFFITLLENLEIQSG